MFEAFRRRPTPSLITKEKQSLWTSDQTWYRKTVRVMVGEVVRCLLCVSWTLDLSTHFAPALSHSSCPASSCSSSTSIYLLLQGNCNCLVSNLNVPLQHIAEMLSFHCMGFRLVQKMLYLSKYSKFIFNRWNSSKSRTACRISQKVNRRSLQPNTCTGV